MGNGEGGAMDVGVAIGVFWLDDCVVVLSVGCFAFGNSPVYCCPSSPGAKVRVEQKPSEDVIRRVRPSLDLKKVRMFQ
jgi:hypothetical protein